VEWLCQRLLLILAVFISPTSFAQDAVLAEHPIAATTVGWDAKARRETRRAAVVTLTTPIILDAATRDIAQRHCAMPALAGWAEEIRSGFDRLPTVDTTLADMVQAGAVEPKPSDVANHRAARVAQIGEFLDASRPVVVKRIRGCLPGALRTTPIAVSIVLRSCPSDAYHKDHPCAGLGKV